MSSDSDPALPLADMLRTARRRQSLSLQEVANGVNQEAAADGRRGVGTNRKRVHSWEGGQIPRPDALRWLARALDLDLARLIAAAHEQMTRRQRERPSMAAGTPHPWLAPQAVGMDHGGDEPRGAALVEGVLPGAGDRIGACPPLRLWLDGRPCTLRVLAAEVEMDEAAAGGPRDGMRRRTFIKLGSLGTVGAAAAPAGVLGPLSSADPRVLDYLEREAERLPVDLRSGPESPNYPRVEDAYELADALLRELPRLRDQVRLHRVTAKLAVLRAESEVFRSRHRLDRAEGWYRLAAERAAEVGDTGLAFWALAHLALNRAWTGAAPRRVVDIVAEARRLGGGQRGAAAAMLSATEARAHARLGDRAALMETLRVAEAELGRAVPSDQVPSVFGFTDAMRMLDAAAAWVLAGESREAEREARQAIALYAPWHTIDLQVVRLHLAAAVADQGRPDEACAVAREALPGPAAHADDRSGWVVHAVSEFDRRVERYRDVTAVQEFRELVTSTGVGA